MRAKRRQKIRYLLARQQSTFVPESIPVNIKNKSIKNRKSKRSATQTRFLIPSDQSPFSSERNILQKRIVMLFAQKNTLVFYKHQVNLAQPQLCLNI